MMERFDIISKGGTAFEKTIDLSNVLGKRVLSKNGQSVGHVRTLRVSDDGLSVKGVVVSRGLFNQPLFIGSGYIDRLTLDSIVLKIDPFLLLKGLKVVSSEGEVIGRVVDFVRVNNTNDLDSLTVKSFMRGSFSVPVNSIKSVGYSIILKPNYEPPKKHFWKGN
jgi:sporulation protein YlmC with PRC-barrel domain